MKINNPYGELIDVIQNIAKNDGGDGFITGTLKANGDVDIGESIIAAEDLSWTTQTVKINGQAVVLPSIKDQSVTVTITHTYTGTQEKITFDFPAAYQAGDDLVLIQLGDGDYTVLGKV